MSQPAPARGSPRFRSLARAVRGLPDRLLHPARRWWARHRLRQLGEPRAVLAVCLGNICRSAYVEASLAKRRGASGTLFSVESAGFLGPGRPSPPIAQEVARSRGVDLSHHRSRLLESVELTEADLILTMDARQAREIRLLDRWDAEVVVLGDLDPHPISRRTIPDPYGEDRPLFEEAFARIDRCLEELIALWGMDKDRMAGA